MRRQILFNGYFLSKRIAGLPRMGYETLKRLDALFPQGRAAVIYPRGCEKNIPILNNIEKLEMGDSKRKGWTTKVAFGYAAKCKMRLVNLVYSFSTCKHSAVCIGDVRYMEKLNNRYPDTLKFRVNLRARTSIGLQNADDVVTISEFSKRRIQHFFRVPDDKITVVPCGWEHMLDIVEDEKVLDKFGLESKSYYFSLGSVAPHKNFRWVMQTARINPDCKFVISGGMDQKVWKEAAPEGLNNLVYTDYVTDQEMKTLMHNSKALVFPSLYEGFGIPPLEALSLGVPCIVSDIPVLREVYGESVRYIDPYTPCRDIGMLLEQPVHPCDEVLKHYSWDKAAETWQALLLKND